MKSDVVRSPMVLVLGFVLGWAGAGLVLRAGSAPPALDGCRTRARQAGQGPDGQRMPLFGKITAVHDSSLEVADTNGDTVTVKITGQTEFRKDRQPAKRTDFKVGDIIVVRGEENADHSWTAQIVAARSMNGPNGPNGRGGTGRPRWRRPLRANRNAGQGLRGRRNQIDRRARNFRCLRSDNVTQTLELNEETSLRKGRDSITMADIQPGDHLFARGAVENDVFVPKTVIVIGPEQWKRMQEMGASSGRRRWTPAAAAGLARAARRLPQRLLPIRLHRAPPPNPPEPQH